MAPYEITPPPSPRPRLLLVDDDTVNLQILKSALKDLYDVDTAMTGEEALKKVLKVPYNLILLDVVMPGLDGHQVCKILKGDEVTMHIPILFLSAEGRSESIVRGFQVGAVDYITKPIIIDVLRARVDTHLRVPALVQELQRQNALLQQLVITDSLTGLYNYTHIHKVLQKYIALAHRHHQALSIVMFDLDEFNNHCEYHGCFVGDEVLQGVAHIFQESIRETDAVGRHGGDEFLLVLSHTDHEGALIIANRIREAVEEHVWPYEGMKITISGGVVTMEEGEGSMAFINRGYAQLKKAKSSGRNSII